MKNLVDVYVYLEVLTLPPQFVFPSELLGSFAIQVLPEEQFT